MNEVKQLKIIAKGQEKRIVLLEAHISAQNSLRSQRRSESGSSNSIEVTDPVQV